MPKTRSLRAQGELFADDAAPEDAKSGLRARRTGTFTDNMRLPVHRWFRYSAGFSADWVESLVATRRREGLVLDPFSGSGTTLLAAQHCGAVSVGLEFQTFVYRVAKAKLHWTENHQEFIEAALRLLELARELARDVPVTTSELLLRCYSTEALCRLEALKFAHREAKESAPIRELMWLAITSILRGCSGAGTAQWQYILPNKSKARVNDPFDAFLATCKIFRADMAEMRASTSTPATMELVFGDARNMSALSHLHNRVSLVVTSPPYPNNYDYADATRLEMTFWDEIATWGDLQKSVRHRLIRSCSQHAAAERLRLETLLEDPTISPIRDELSTVCNELADVRETKGGKKAYHTMIAAYFADLAKVWLSLRPLCLERADIHFVIGDSAPYGVYVPVDRWLGELAVAAGFKGFEFEKVRDRNLKWKNRKHRVPLKEGNLRVVG
jgi:hypothetical protein